MEAQLVVTQEGFMYADFFMDNAPRGFEDCLPKSTLYRRLHQGTAFAELGEPYTDHLTGDPQATLRRIYCLDEKNICAFITVQPMDLTGDWIRAKLKPCGPHAETLRERWLTNPNGLKAKFRFMTANDEEGDLTVTDIYAIDVIQN